MEINRHATIVAFYGDDKPSALQQLVYSLQESVTAKLGSAFSPRPLHDVHATIIGLEVAGPLSPDSDLGELRKLSSTSPDVVGLCQYFVSNLAATPLMLQFGGFENRDYQLTSRGSRLFDRSFTVNGDKVVLMGWPVDDIGSPIDSLNALRRSAGQYKVQHRYFSNPEDRDPDAYIVIGEIIGEVAELRAVLDAIRFDLSRTSNRVVLSPQDVRVAIYDDTKLPRATTKSRLLEDFLSDSY